MFSYTQVLLANRKFFLIVGIPILLSPLLFVRVPALQCTSDGSDGNGVQECDDEEDPMGRKRLQCVFIILLMSSYWISEAVPLAVTSLLPVFLFPFFSILDTAQVVQAYMKESGMMVVTSLIIVNALEYSKLHIRIALRIMMTIGGSAPGLLLGVMITTAFLSMWMPGLCATTMMIPIVLAVVDELHRSDSCLTAQDTSTDLGNESAESAPARDMNQNCNTQRDAAKKRSKQMYLLGLGYASKLGSSGTIIGTSANLVFRELIKAVDVTNGGRLLDINFATWMAFNLPGLFLNVFFTWIYLMAMFSILPKWSCRKSLGSEQSMRTLPQSDKKSSQDPASNDKPRSMIAHLRSEYKEQGPITFHEIVVGFLFLTLIILWFTRKPGFMPGWGQYFGVNVGDPSASMLIVFLLFILPKEWPFSSGSRRRQQEQNGGVGTALNWGYVHTRLNWAVIFLTGSGFAISDASIKTGLSTWIADGMNEIRHLPPWAILLITMITISLTTEVISNTTCANIFLPILLAMAERLSLHPLYLSLPATNAGTFSFMLPAANKSMLLVFGAANGDLTIWDVVKNGIFLNLLCVTVAFLINISYGSWLFSYDSYSYEN